MLNLVQHDRVDDLRMTGDDAEYFGMTEQEKFFSKKREKYLKQMLFCYILMKLAEMVELVDTRDLKSLVS